MKIMSNKKKVLYVFVLFALTVSAQNIALQKTVSVSSTESATHPGNLAVDGDMTTRWASDRSDPQFIVIDLGEKYTIDRVVIFWEAAFSVHYQLQLSNNGQQWDTVATVTNGDGGNDTLTFTPQLARYVRMYGLQRTTIGGVQYGYSIYEFEVYGSSAADNANLVGLSIDGVPLTGFSSTQYAYDYMLEPEETSIPIVTATTANSAATYTIDNAPSLSGTTTVTVTSADGTQTAV